MRLILLPALRRLAASLMLVALASFVLHGGAMAGQHRHDPGKGGCDPIVSAEHGHGAALHAFAHHHADGAHHVHAGPLTVDLAHGDLANSDLADSDRHHANGAPEAPCCGSACGVALPALASGAISVLITADAVLLPVSQDGAGTEPQGVKRPPRTPSIA